MNSATATASGTATTTARIAARTRAEDERGDVVDQALAVRAARTAVAVIAGTDSDDQEDRDAGEDDEDRDPGDHGEVGEDPVAARAAAAGRGEELSGVGGRVDCAHGRSAPARSSRAAVAMPMRGAPPPASPRSACPVLESAPTTDCVDGRLDLLRIWSVIGAEPALPGRGLLTLGADDVVQQRLDDVRRGGVVVLGAGDLVGDEHERVVARVGRGRGRGRR